MGRAKTASGDPALTPFITLYAREGADGQAVVCPLLRGSSPTRWVAPKQHRGCPALTPFLHYAREGADGQAVVCPLLRGSSPTRWVASKRHRVAPACFLSGISGWFSLSLGAWVPKKLARRSMEVWLRRRRRRFRFSDFRFEAAAATLSGTGSASPRPDRNSWALTLFLHP